MSNITRAYLGTYEGISPYLKEVPHGFEAQLNIFLKSRRGSQLQWTNIKNTHLYSSIKGTPIWIPLAYHFNKLNPLEVDLLLFVETKGKIDVFDYAKEIKESLKPEMFTILKTGLSEVIGLKDE